MLILLINKDPILSKVKGKKESILDSQVAGSVRQHWLFSSALQKSNQK